MKKVVVSILAIGLVAIPFVNNGQEEEGGFTSAVIGGGNSCVSQCISSLEDCLNESSINYRLIVTGNTADLYTVGTCPSGLVNSCVSQYNSNKISCASAPVIVKKGSRR